MCLNLLENNKARLLTFRTQQERKLHCVARILDIPGYSGYSG